MKQNSLRTRPSYSSRNPLRTLSNPTNLKIIPIRIKSDSTLHSARVILPLDLSLDSPLIKFSSIDTKTLSTSCDNIIDLEKPTLFNNLSTIKSIVYNIKTEAKDCLIQQSNNSKLKKQKNLISQTLKSQNDLTISTQILTETKNITKILNEKLKVTGSLLLNQSKFREELKLNLALLLKKSQKQIQLKTCNCCIY